MATIKCFGRLYEGSIVEMKKKRVVVAFSNGKRTYTRKLPVVRTEQELQAAGHACVLIPESAELGFQLEQPVRLRHGYSANPNRPRCTIVQVCSGGWYRVRNPHGSTFIARGSELEGALADEEE